MHASIVRFLLPLAISLGAPTWAQAFDLSPVAACDLLAAEGLAARGGYQAKSAGQYQCASRRKPLNAGGARQHEIRFYARGDEQSVHSLALELSLKSREDIQRGHRLLARYASTLVTRALEATLPEAVEEAILSGIDGTWSDNGLDYSLRRITLASPGYELRLDIR